MSVYINVADERFTVIKHILPFACAEDVDPSTLELDDLPEEPAFVW